MTENSIGALTQTDDPSCLNFATDHKKGNIRRKCISAKSVIKRTLQVFEDWIEAVAGEVVKSKQICYQSLQEVIQVALALFPVYISQPGILVYITSDLLM